MLDIGWTELLVIAVVLIVVVGPKDLPPMLRAFGKMTANLRKMAGDFRTQFDQALREADMDDVRQTITDVQRFHPANALREAINPLRDMGNEIRNDLQKATTLPAAATDGGEEGLEQLLPTSDLSLPDTPPASLAPAQSQNAPVAAAPAQPASSAAAAPAPASAPSASAASAAPAPSPAPAQSVPADGSAPAATAAVKTPRAPRKPKAPAVAEPVAAAKPATRRPRAAKPAAAEPAAETVAAAKPAARPRKKPATPKDNA